MTGRPPAIADDDIEVEVRVIRNVQKSSNLE
jgi:hypothetical protein